MSFHEILIAVMAAFGWPAPLTGFFGNRWGWKNLKRESRAAGSLALAMVGIVCLAPVLASLLKPVIVPVFAFLGADPAMFPEPSSPATWAAVRWRWSWQQFSGGHAGRRADRLHAGATVVFHHPVAMGILEERTGRSWRRESSAASSPFRWAFSRAALRQDSHRDGVAQPDPHCHHRGADCSGTVAGGKRHGQGL